jgi:hypothetical protein
MNDLTLQSRLQPPEGPNLQPKPEETIDLIEYWRAISKRRWSILGLTVLVSILAFLVVSNMRPIYRGNRRPGELGSDVIVPKLRDLGYSIIYTRYDTGGHSIWTTAYQHPLLLPWMFAQRRGQALDKCSEQGLNRSRSCRQPVVDCR